MPNWGEFFTRYGEGVNRKADLARQLQLLQEERARQDAQRGEDVAFRNKGLDLQTQEFEANKRNQLRQRQLETRQMLGPGEITPEQAGEVGPFATRPETLGSTQFSPSAEPGGMPVKTEAPQVGKFSIPANFLERRQEAEDARKKFEQQRIDTALGGLTGPQRTQALTGVDTETPGWAEQQRTMHGYRMQEKPPQPQLSREVQMGLDLLKTMRPNPEYDEDGSQTAAWQQRVNQFIKQNHLESFLNAPEAGGGHEPPPMGDNSDFTENNGRGIMKGAAGMGSSLMDFLQSASPRNVATGIVKNRGSILRGLGGVEGNQPPENLAPASQQMFQSFLQRAEDAKKQDEFNKRRAQRGF